VHQGGETFTFRRGQVFQVSIKRADRHVANPLLLRCLFMYWRIKQVLWLLEHIILLSLAFQASQEKVRVATLQRRDAKIVIRRHQLVIDECQLVQWAKVEPRRHYFGIRPIIRLQNVLDNDTVAVGQDHMIGVKPLKILNRLFRIL